jgi:hypothetical protein
MNAGIDEGDLSSGFKETSATFNYRYQYARVTSEFVDQFDMYNPTIVAENVSIGDEVVRRLKQNVIDVLWSARTKTRAASILVLCRDDSEYGAATATLQAPGWYDVSATRILVDPAGWSPWIRVQDLDQYAEPE